MKILTKIKSIGKHLPKPIKHIIRPFYIKVKGKERIIVYKELLQDTAEFHNRIDDSRINYQELDKIDRILKQLNPLDVRNYMYLIVSLFGSKCYYRLSKLKHSLNN